MPITWMLKKDLQSVIEIEDLSFQKPWTEDQFHRFLNGRLNVALVHRESDIVKGFAFYTFDKDYIHLLSVAVHPIYRRCGIGKGFLDKIKDKVVIGRRKGIQTTVCETNLVGHLFLKSCGLRAIGIEKGALGPNRDGYNFCFKRGD